MLLQSYQRPFVVDNVDYMLYSITNASSPQMDTNYGDDQLPGLDVRIVSVSEEQWAREIWDNIEYHALASETNLLPEAVMSEIFLALFSGKDPGDWKITALGLFMDGLYIDIVNDSLMRQYDFLKERERSAQQPQNNESSLTSWIPAFRLRAYLSLPEKVPSLVFTVKDISGVDQRQYEIFLRHDNVEIDESAPHHRRNLVFSKPTEITEPNSSLQRWVYTVDVQEATLFQ